MWKYKNMKQLNFLTLSYIYYAWSEKNTVFDLNPYRKSYEHLNKPVYI